MIASLKRRLGFRCVKSRVQVWQECTLHGSDALISCAKREFKELVVKRGLAGTEGNATDVAQHVCDSGLSYVCFCLRVFVPVRVQASGNLHVIDVAGGREEAEVVRPAPLWQYSYEGHFGRTTQMLAQSAAMARQVEAEDNMKRMVKGLEKVKGKHGRERCDANGGLCACALACSSVCRRGLKAPPTAPLRRRASATV